MAETKRVWCEVHQRWEDVPVDVYQDFFGLTHESRNDAILKHIEQVEQDETVEVTTTESGLIVVSEKDGDDEHEWPGQYL